MTEETPSLSVGRILIGPLFNEPMRLETVQLNGAAGWIVGLVGTNSERFRKVTITAEDLEHLTILDPRHSFNGDGRLLRLAIHTSYETRGVPIHAFGFLRLPVRKKSFFRGWRTRLAKEECDALFARSNVLSLGLQEVPSF